MDFISRNNVGGASRWRKPKTWKSSSSPEIHQNYIYMWNNYYRTPTECWQKTSDLPKGKKLPTYLGRVKEKRNNKRQKNGDGTCTSGRVLWRRKCFHTLGSPFAGRDCGLRRREASEPRRRAQQQGCGGQRGEIPTQRIGADQHSPDREACLLTHWGGRGLGVEAPASVVFYGEDWGWLCEHSLKGASVPQLAGRESGKKYGAAKEARDFFLPLCFLVC